MAKDAYDADTENIKDAMRDGVIEGVKDYARAYFDAEFDGTEHSMESFVRLHNVAGALLRLIDLYDVSEQEADDASASDQHGTAESS